MRNDTLMAPVGPAASSSARETVSPTSRVSCSDSGECARHLRTKSRMSGIAEGLAGNVCDTTTTGTTSMLSLIMSPALSIAPFPEVNLQIGTAQRWHLTHQTTWTNPCRRGQRADRYVQLDDSSVLNA